MRTIRILALVLSAPIALSLLTGCGDRSAPVSEQPNATPHAEDHDPDDVHLTADDVERPEDFTAAVARIRQYRDTIRDEIAAGRPGKAHRPLDEATFVLEWLPEIARDSGVPREHWEEVNTSAQTIRTAFDQVHANIDKGQDPNYEAVADQVRQAIERLERTARETSESTEHQ